MACRGAVGLEAGDQSQRLMLRDFGRTRKGYKKTMKPFFALKDFKNVNVLYESGVNSLRRNMCVFSLLYTFCSFLHKKIDNFLMV